MFPRVIDVRHVGGYLLHLSFSDGTCGELDFRERVVGRGGAFHALENVDTFAQVRVDAEAGTIVWPNGLDFCPDVLYSEVTGKDLSEMGTHIDVA